MARRIAISVQIRRHLGFGVLAALAALASCSDAPDADRAATEGPPLATLPADAALSALEDRMLEIDPRQIQFVVVAEGGPDAEMRGALVLLGDEGLEISADGEYDGQPRALRLAADERRVRLGEGADSIVVPRPAGLEEAVVIGFTRMGIYPNLQRIAARMPLNHIEGGVRDQVVVKDIAWGPSETVEGRPAISLDYALEVNGGPAGEVRLYLDEATELPLLRRHVVLSPEGDSTITETYEFF